MSIPLLRRPKPPTLKENSDENKTTLNFRAHLKAQYDGDVQVVDDLRIYPLNPSGPPPFPQGRVLKGGAHFMGMSFGGALRLLQNEMGNLRDSGGLSGVLGDLEEDQSLEVTSQQIMMPSSLNKAVISKQNYLKLTSWFATQVPRQEQIHTVTIAAPIQEKTDRVPFRQTVVELKALLEEVLLEDMPEQAEIGFKPKPSAEISRELEERSKRWQDLIGEKSRFIHASKSKYFCGEGRTGSPFAEPDGTATPAELAVIESMLNGGHILSLKAHFISTLPDLSPLSTTLVYLNVSFNDLRTFPLTILSLEQLVCLKMRNNPLKEIPEAISKLKKLEILCVSFCLLSSLPKGLYTLKSLVELDVAHNSIQWLSTDLNQLSKLKKLYLQGNELAGLPSSAVNLKLKQLNVENNFMHPLLWREMTRNQPMRLFDMCLVCIDRSKGRMQRLPFEVTQWLQGCRGKECQMCRKPMYGSGMRLIRAVENCPSIMKELPFIFNVCSVNCKQRLRQNLI